MVGSGGGSVPAQAVMINMSTNGISAPALICFLTCLAAIISPFVTHRRIRRETAVALMGVHVNSPAASIIESSKGCQWIGKKGSN
jgi:hypothetical protein